MAAFNKLACYTRALAGSIYLLWTGLVFGQVQALDTATRIELGRVKHHGVFHAIAEPSKVKSVIALVRSAPDEEWKPFIGKFGGCTIELTVYAGQTQIAVFAIDRRQVFFRPHGARLYRYREVSASAFEKVRALIPSEKVPAACRRASHA